MSPVTPPGQTTQITAPVIVQEAPQDNYALTSVSVWVNGIEVPSLNSLTITPNGMSWSSKVSAQTLADALLAVPNVAIKLAHGQNVLQASCTLDSLTFIAAPSGDTIQVSYRFTGAKAWQ